MKCIICELDFAEEDLQCVNKKNVCSGCIDKLIKQDITGGKDVVDLLEHIKANNRLLN